MSILLFYLIISMFIVLSLSKRKSIINNIYTNIVFISLFVIISWFAVFNDNMYISDKGRYSRMFLFFVNSSIKDAYDSIDTEPFYVFTVWILSKLTTDLTTFYLLLNTIFLIVLIKSLLNLYRTDEVSLVLFFYINSFFYYSYMLNGLRQGIAIVFLILAFTYYDKSKMKVFLFVVVSGFFHYTSFLPGLLLFLLIKFNEIIKIRYLLLIFSICSVLYVLDLQRQLLGWIDFEYLNAYSREDYIEKYGGSNKIGFLFFNAFFAFLGYIKLKFHSSKQSIFIYKYYLLTSIAFLLLGFISYADRVAAYSWFFIPIMLGNVLTQDKLPFLIKALILLIFVVLGINFGISETILGTK